MGLKKSFETTYPSLLFDDLKKQNDEYFTNDGCIYYRHSLNKKIYSWNYDINIWQEETDELLYLFR